VYVFIDESGQFNAPRDIADIANYECIVAVALTDQVLEEIEEQFGDKDKEFLRRNAKDIIRILITRNCTAFAVIIDANSCTAAKVQDHKADYINSISQSSLIYQPFLFPIAEYPSFEKLGYSAMGNKFHYSVTNYCFIANNSSHIDYAV